MIVSFTGTQDGTTEAQHIREVFGFAHPIFGMSSPTAEEALEAGKRWAS